MAPNLAPTQSIGRPVPSPEPEQITSQVWCVATQLPLPGGSGTVTSTVTSVCVTSYFTLQPSITVPTTVTASGHAVTSFVAEPNPDFVTSSPPPALFLSTLVPTAGMPAATSLAPPTHNGAPSSLCPAGNVLFPILAAGLSAVLFFRRGRG